VFNKLKIKKFKEIQPRSEKNIIITSILVECAKEDGEILNIEKNKIKTLLKSKLKMSQEEANQTFNEAIELAKNRVEMYSLTKEIRENFERNEIIKILEYMWLIVLSDGKLDDFEAALMSKAVGLFHLTGRESAEARKNAENELS
tara:strand:- start:24 stop:458 length:435 start_codon:yes stop_codon:yes gene_type:complete